MKTNKGYSNIKLGGLLLCKLFITLKEITYSYQQAIKQEISAFREQLYLKEKKTILTKNFKIKCYWNY